MYLPLRSFKIKILGYGAVFLFKWIQQMLFLKREISLRMYVFCIVVINIVLKERNELCQARKDSALSPQLYPKRIIENMFKKRKKSTKNHADSCYYAMLLIKFFSVQVHTWEIKINLDQLCTVGRKMGLTFIPSGGSRI